MAIMLHAFLVNVSFVFERRVKGNIMDGLFVCLSVEVKYFFGCYRGVNATKMGLPTAVL